MAKRPFRRWYAEERRLFIQDLTFVVSLLLQQRQDGHSVDGPKGKRIIIPDPDSAPIITELFERFATGEYSLDGFIAQVRTMA